MAGFSYDLRSFLPLSIAVQGAGPLAEQLGIEHLDALGRIGLAAAADAAAGAGHHLDHVELLLAGLDLVQQDLGVGQAVGHADVDVVLADGHVGFAQALDGADLGELQPVGRLAGDQFAGGPERGLHHAAGGAEDVAGAAGQAQRGVELARRQRREVDPVALDHPDQFPRGQHGVGIRRAVGHEMLGPPGLVLLRHAGHHRHHEDLLRIDARLLGVVGLRPAPRACSSASGRSRRAGSAPG